MGVKKKLRRKEKGKEMHRSYPWDLVHTIRQGREELEMAK